MLLNQFIKDTRGNFALIAAICTIPLCVAGGLAIDYSTKSAKQTKLQDAVDAAVLAAGRDMAKLDNKEIKALVREFVRANLDRDDANLIRNIKIVVDRREMCLKATAKADVATTFGQLAGIKKLRYEATASVQSAYGGIEVVLVLDNTGSMGMDGKLDALKAAAGTFVNDMMEANANGDIVKIGIVPFGQYVNVGTNNRKARWLDLPNANEEAWNGCVGSRENPLNLQDTRYNKRVPALMGVHCPGPVLELSTDEKKLTASIASMNASGATYLPSGLIWGLRTISSKTPFTGGTSRKEAERENVTKAIVLMTDGENTMSKQPKGPLHNQGDREQADGWTRQLCETIKSEDVVIYSMSFGSQIGADTKAMLSACASNPQSYIHASDAAALNAAFSDIAASLTRLYLTQ